MENNGLTGLINLGNTCFMNAALQCLSNTIPLTKYILSDDFSTNVKEKHKNARLILEYRRLLTAIWSENCKISPNSFHRVLQVIGIRDNLNINFGNFTQNDVQEFLVFFIDNMHEVLSREVIISINGVIKNDLDKMAMECMKSWKMFFKDNYSQIIDIFYGQLVYTSYNKRNLTDIVSRVYQPTCFFLLPIPMKKSITIYDCLDLYVENEEISITDEKTKENVSCIRNIRAWRFPNVLILCFNRFTNDRVKINLPIDFPINDLNLNKYVVGYEKQKSIYDLFAICNHMGGLGGGHYTAYCKNANGRWYLYNDGSVTAVDKASDVVSQKAYVLFYRKKGY